MRFSALQAASFLAAASVAWSFRVEKVQKAEVKADGSVVGGKESAKTGDTWSLLHITDMQYGMLNSFETDKTFAPEEKVMKAVVKKFMGSDSEDITFIGGDMQDAWAWGDNAEQRGQDQRTALTQELKNTGRTNFIFTPGNHDIADKFGNATGDTVESYTANWHTAMEGNLYENGLSDGKGLWGSFKKGKQLVLVLTSQFYAKVFPPPQPATDAPTTTTLAPLPDVVNDKQAGEQNKFIAEVMESAKSDSSINSIVVLTHIPPFMESMDEPAGWANWDTAYRSTVMESLAKAGKPITFVCGHFHATVFNSISYAPTEGEKVEVQVLVTTAAATTLHWGGLSTLSPTKAKEAAAQPIGSAFGTLIMQGDKKPYRDEANPKEAAVALLKFDDKGLVVGEGGSEWCYVEKPGWFTTDQTTDCVKITGKATQDVTAVPEKTP